MYNHRVKGYMHFKALDTSGQCDFPESLFECTFPIAAEYQPSFNTLQQCVLSVKYKQMNSFFPIR